MAHSLAQTIAINCPDCGQDYDIVLWLIIDADERPDLINKIADGSLHTATCPHCGKGLTLDAPLLLFFADREPHLVFSPQERTTHEQDEQALKQLLHSLRSELEEGWQDEWLEGLQFLPFETLPVFLEKGLAAAQESFISSKEEFDHLAHLLQDWIDTDTWMASLSFLREHPQLLWNKTIQVSAFLLEQAHKENHGDLE